MNVVPPAARGLAPWLAACVAWLGSPPAAARAAEAETPAAAPTAAETPAAAPTAAETLAGLRRFYQATARPDGSFQPGVDPDYLGMSDCAYSDLAAATYACTIHATFGWKLPFPDKTLAFLRLRQRSDGSFFNVAGTVDPDSPAGRTYNTTQGLVALRALGEKPTHDALAVFEEILKEDYKTLPAYSTSFFPLAYLCAGRPIPAQADRGVRALMIQDATGYLNNHVAATFHASHYYRLVGEETPKSAEMVARALREQKADGSWLVNLPNRDRHGTFDAVFTLRHEGGGRADCREAIARAARWALSCRNDDGGFGHYPGSTSDADAVYFQVGTLVMAGWLPPVEPPPPDAELLSWGHLMPVVDRRPRAPALSLKLPAWAADIGFAPSGARLVAAGADHRARVFEVAGGRETQVFSDDGRRGHRDILMAARFHPDANRVAAAGYDRQTLIWNTATGAVEHELVGHAGAVLDLAYDPSGSRLATAGMDRVVKLWRLADGQCTHTLVGHKSWVNAVAFAPDGQWLASASSDGGARVWDVATGAERKVLTATRAELYSLAIRPDGRRLAVGARYGQVHTWNTDDWSAQAPWHAHEGDVWAAAYSPDSRWLATGGGDWNRPGVVKLWDADTGRLHRTLQHTGEVFAVAFSPDGALLAASGGDGTVKVWRLER